MKDNKEKELAMSNRANKTKAKSSIKKFCSSKEKNELETNYRKAVSTLMEVGRKGVFHKNKVRRLVSRLSVKKLNMFNKMEK